MKRLLTALAAFALAVAGLQAQQAKKRLTVELVTNARGLSTPGAFRLEWRPSGQEISYVKPQGSGTGAASAIYLYDIASGKERVLLGPPNDTVENEKLNLASYRWSPGGDALLLEGDEDLWLYTVATAHTKRVAKRSPSNEAMEDVSFSPTGDRLAFVKQNNLYALHLATGQTEKLTSDGNDTVMNGKLDWVYEEELAQRSTGRAYQWSPDGKKIAYLSLDDTPVPQYPLTHFLSDHVTLTQQRFPQAGDPNPKPSMHVVTVGNGESRSWTYPLKDPDAEYLSPEFTWTPDSKGVAFSTLNRPQTDLAVHLWDPASGMDRKLLEERDRFWINAIDAPHFLKDGRHFLWLSERDGWMHLYLYKADGLLERQLGSGDWMIDRSTFSNPGANAFEVDEQASGKASWVYFTSTDPDPRQRQLYRVRMDTGAMERLSKDPGTHGLSLSPGGQYLLDSFSSVTTPTETRLLKSDGTPVSTLSKVESHWADYALGATEFVTIKASDDATLYARLVKPPEFDPTKRYPVIVDVYGGPDVQLVRNFWGVTGGDDQLLAEQGYVIWSLDNRGSWGRGHAWESAIFEAMGKHEVEDQLAGINYLKSLPYVDPSRIGVRGWSYGGYMTLELLTRAPGVFKCGAAGGPVTDWKFYDSIYTERYMRTPKENPEGYKTSSPLESADKLKARVLLIHGTDDDNVHLQNTMNFAEALIKARTTFELYLQPGEMHGFAGQASRLYLTQRLLDFFQQNL